MLLDWCDEPNWLAGRPGCVAASAAGRVLTRLHRLPVPSVVMAVRAHSAGYRARLARVPTWLPALERGCWPAASPPIAGSLPS